MTMAQLSDDGFWQFENGRWVPSLKQLEALSEGAVPHTETEFEVNKLDNKKIFSIKIKH